MLKTKSTFKRTLSLLLSAIIIFSISAFAATPTTASAVSKIKKNKGNFFLKLNKTLCDTSYDMAITHKYKIYSFNVKSKGAKAYNKKLYNYFINYYKDDYKAYLQNASLDCGIKGNTYKNGNILSIRQKATASSWWEYKAYNINKKTGKKVTTANLYKKFGYTKKSFFKALKKKQLSKIKRVIKESPGIANYADEMVSYAKSSKSRKGVQAYLDGSGKLCAIAKLDIAAGAGIYQYIFKLSKVK